MTTTNRLSRFGRRASLALLAGMFLLTACGPSPLEQLAGDQPGGTGNQPGGTGNQPGGNSAATPKPTPNPVIEDMSQSCETFEDAVLAAVNAYADSIATIDRASIEVAARAEFSSDDMPYALAAAAALDQASNEAFDAARAFAVQDDDEARTAAAATRDQAIARAVLQRRDSVSSAAAANAAETGTTQAAFKASILDAHARYKSAVDAANDSYDDAVAAAQARLDGGSAPAYAAAEISRVAADAAEDAVAEATAAYEDAYEEWWYAEAESDLAAIEAALQVMRDDALWAAYDAAVEAAEVAYEAVPEPEGNAGMATWDAEQKAAKDAAKVVYEAALVEAYADRIGSSSGGGGADTYVAALVDAKGSVLAAFAEAIEELASADGAFADCSLDADAVREAIETSDEGPRS